MNIPNVNIENDNVIPLQVSQRSLEDTIGYAPEFSEAGMSLLFAGKYKDRLRYVADWKSWYAWTGTFWEEEKTCLAYDFIGRECRMAAKRAIENENTKDCVRALSKAATRGAIEAISRTDRRLAATTDQWDADDWLLNTPGGIIDLRTGENLGHDQTKYCSKITLVAACGEYPLWLQFLDKVTGGDKELQAYLQRMCGYFITGSVEEQALFFLYGPGGNGKGVFLNTICAILRNYHVVSPAETFAEQKNRAHPTELAHLQGARLVISQETEEGQHWAEARIKSLTGGDRITARKMHCNFFTFDPKFKLCIVGNHKPKLHSVDDAIRRRFNLVPFNIIIPKDEQDPHLSEKLKSEYGGILRWMIEGCTEWLEKGLKPPEAVLAATAEYLEDEDTVGRWLRDSCIFPDWNEKPTLVSLFASWKKYAEAANINPGDDKRLKAELIKRGFEPKKMTVGVVVPGLRLKTWDDRKADRGQVE